MKMFNNAFTKNISLEEVLGLYEKGFTCECNDGFVQQIKRYV